jgi:hypothetical protein
MVKHATRLSVRTQWDVFLLQIEGLPTMVFVSSDVSKPAIRTEGLLPAETIIKIITDELTALPDVPAAAGQS